MGSIAAGFVAAFGICLSFGGPLVSLLKRVGARQTVSADAPTRHQQKQGTPTMGGLLILVGICVPVLVDVASRTEHATALVLLGLTLAFGLIGFVDDYLIATRGKNLGLMARQKLALQFVFAAIFMLWMGANATPGRTTILDLGRLGEYDLGYWYYIGGMLFIVGLSNAVNFLDGLDGLCSGVCTIIALAMGGAVLGVAGFGWLALYCGALAGACAGFLWFNCNPAQVFMGDTGSLALGAALAGIAMLGKVEAPFQVYALVPWAELISVIIQVSVFRMRKARHGVEYARAHRVFRRTPLHHHFEELGMAETKIVQRFWLVTAIVVAVTFAISMG